MNSINEAKSERLLSEISRKLDTLILVSRDIVWAIEQTSQLKDEVMIYAKDYENLTPRARRAMESLIERGVKHWRDISEDRLINLDMCGAASAGEILELRNERLKNG